MFDLRYHVASLAAVFLALIIGILVGVGISDRGLVDKGKSKLLEDQVASLQRRLDATAQQSTSRTRERMAAQSFISEAYPALVRNRLRGKKIAVVFVGPVDGGVRTAVKKALADSGAEQLRLRALKVPIDVRQLDATLNGEPAGKGLRGKRHVDALGRALGQELMLGGSTPLWDSVTDALVQEQAGGTRAPADGVVVVRTVTPQRGATSRFLVGLYSALASSGGPAVGVEPSDSADSATKVFTQTGLSTVDDVDTPVGRLATVLLLAGAPPGHYGVKDSASDGTLPPLGVPGG